MNAPSINIKDIMLHGLDGSNPLAFLAALGTLRTAQRAISSRKVSLVWETSGTKYLPRLVGAVSDQDELVSLLTSELPSNEGSPWNLSKRLPFEVDFFKKEASRAATSASTGNREVVDTLSSFGSEVLVGENGYFSDTALRMVRSGDSVGQGMLDYAQKIRANLTTDDLQHALFDQWRYTASGPSLRWDPGEAREYALLASDPSKEGVLSVIGANRLALEAMAFFTTCVSGQKLATVGFHTIDTHVEMTWPLWNIPLTLPLIHSLLTLDCLSSARLRADDLKARGIAVVFRSRMYKPNKYYSNFRPARAVMT